MQQRWTRGLALGVGTLVLLGVFHALYGGFFPNRQGGLGADYSQHLPALLDGYFWASRNGYLSIPWFTAAFCGGQPVFPDPQSMYFSVPQWLTPWGGPLPAVYATMLLFAALGGGGMALLARRVFAASWPAAVVAAVLFMFNGFFVHRMLVGHLTFHAVMLLPWLALGLWHPLPGSATAPGPRWRRGVHAWCWGSLAGLAAAYQVHAGAGVMAPVLVWALLLLAILAAWRGQPIWRQWPQALVAAGVALGLALPKWWASVALLSHFPRDDYALPGFASVDAALGALGQALFWPSATGPGQTLANAEWALGRHEFDMGLGPVAAILLLGGGVLWAGRGWRQGWRPQPRDCGYALGLAGLLLVPLALVIYHPAWHELLKSMPFVRSQSNLFRGWFAYVPLVALGAGLALDVWWPQAQRRAVLAGVAVLAILGGHASANLDSYQEESYQAQPIQDSYQKVAHGVWTPRIESIGAFVDPAQGVLLLQNRNDLLIHGVSQLACYNPIFGYRLEKFPQGALRLGAWTDEVAGRLNLKNPACYVFPQENTCQPGDHFAVAELEQASALTEYRPYAFRMPDGLAASLWLMSATALLVPLGWVLGGWWCWRRRT